MVICMMHYTTKPIYRLMLRKLTPRCCFTSNNTQTSCDTIQHIIKQLRWKRSIAPFVYYFSGVCAIQFSTGAQLPYVFGLRTKMCNMATTGSNVFCIDVKWARKPLDLIFNFTLIIIFTTV